jgi:hypothetical protein
MNTLSLFSRMMWLAILLLSQPIAAQSIYQQNNNVLGVGIGFGGYYSDASGATRESPVMNVNFERAIWPLSGEKVKGIVSMGGLVGYKQSSLSNTIGYYNYSYNVKWRYTVLAARAAWHLQSFNGKELKKWDLYWGILLGVNLMRRTYTDNFSGADYGSNLSSTFTMFGGYFGARYFFNPNFAVTAETGFGYSSLNLGAAYKF